MATASTECYCGMSELDILKLIFESDQAIFDRLSQVISAAAAGGASCCAEAGIQALVNGSDTVSVVFPVPFASPPVVLVTISRNAALPLIDANVDRLSVTALGFSATLGAAPVGGDYRLNWMAQIATP